MRIPLLCLCLLTGCSARMTVFNKSMVPVESPPPDWRLFWDNPNPPELWPRLWIEIHSTTNLTEPFEVKLWQPTGGFNYVYISPTNQQEFFIARFALIEDGGTNYSGWNVNFPSP